MNAPINTRCRCCKTKEGALHIFGCERERCFKCGGQFIYCSCKKDRIKRTPFIVKTNVCRKCGILNPKLFMVSDREWKKVIWPEFKEDDLLCDKCYDIIRKYKGIKKGKRGYIRPPIPSSASSAAKKD